MSYFKLRLRTSLFTCEQAWLLIWPSQCKTPKKWLNAPGAKMLTTAEPRCLKLNRVTLSGGVDKWAEAWHLQSQISLYVGRKCVDSKDATLLCSDLVERLKYKEWRKKKHEIRVGCDWLFLSNSSTHCVRSSRPAALHLAKDKANRGGRRCEGWRWMGPLQGSRAHAGCDVCACKCVCVRLRSQAQCGGHSANITEAYLKLGILCVWLVFGFFFVVVHVEGCVGVCKLCLKKLRPPQAVIALPSIKDTFAHFLWLTVYKTNNITHPWQLLLSL